MGLEKRLDSVFKIIMLGMGIAYCANSGYVAFRAIAKKEPVEKKIGYIFYSGINGFLGYYLIKNKGKL